MEVSVDALEISVDALEASILDLRLTQAVILILQMVEAQLIELVNSSVLEYENSQNPFPISECWKVGRATPASSGVRFSHRLNSTKLCSAQKNCARYRIIVLGTE